jgi:hypothetical protein
MFDSNDTQPSRDGNSLKKHQDIDSIAIASIYITIWLITGQDIQFHDKIK